jgi:hypothetical protein
MSGFAGPSEGDRWANPNAFHALNRVESLARMHSIIHGAKSSFQTPTSASRFIHGMTGEPAVDDMGFCNMCGKHTIADGK